MIIEDRSVNPPQTAICEGCHCRAKIHHNDITIQEFSPRLPGFTYDEIRNAIENRFGTGQSPHAPQPPLDKYNRLRAATRERAEYLWVGTGADTPDVEMAFQAFAPKLQTSADAKHLQDMFNSLRPDHVRDMGANFCAAPGRAGAGL